MQEIITLIILAMIIAAAGFWTGLCWSERCSMDMQYEIELQKALNKKMKENIKLYEAQIEHKNKIIENHEIIQHELKSQVNLLHAITSLN